jgi:hypothetical protein
MVLALIGLIAPDLAARSPTGTITACRDRWHGRAFDVPELPPNTTRNPVARAARPYYPPGALTRRSTDRAALLVWST